MNNYCTLDQKIAYVCNCEYRFFFNKANVVGIGLGYKIKNGFYTFKKTITVFVSKKIPLNKLSSENRIPKIYKGITTDVIESGYFFLSSLRKKIRPVLGGYSIGVDGLIDGTMGCLVGDSKYDYILTCNHVVAGNTEKSFNKPVVQPAPKYGGKLPHDIVGIVANFIPVHLDDNNMEDAAIVQTDRSKASIAISFLGPIKGTDFPKLGEIVEKVGSTTELTNGVIENTRATIKVDFLGRETTFKEQIVTTKMSDAGDSGSVLLTSKRKAIGFLMANSNTCSIFNNINFILERLEVHILRN